MLVFKAGPGSEYMFEDKAGRLNKLPMERRLEAESLLEDYWNLMEADGVPKAILKFGMHEIEVILYQDFNILIW